MTSSLSRRAWACAASGALVLAACGGDDSSSDTTTGATEPAVTEPAVTEPAVTEPAVTEPPATEPPATEPPATEPPETEPPATEPPATEPPAEPLQIMVTNDDGVDALGIDAIVQGLLTLENVVVTVVAPLENASGSGGSTTDGELVASETETASGYPAIAIDGFPADTVVWAVEQGGLGFVPDLVVSGVNEGQNIGPLVDISGTVGAARAAAQRNIPAIAVSAGLTVNGVPENYPAAVEAALTWLRDNVADVAGHAEGDPVDVVISINAPTCITGGEVRGSLEVPLTMDIGDVDIVSDVDCNSTKPAEDIANDVDAFVNGFVAVAETPIAPPG